MELSKFYRKFRKVYEKFIKQDLTVNGEICTDDKIFMVYFNRQIIVRTIFTTNLYLGTSFERKVVQLSVSADIAVNHKSIFGSPIWNLGNETDEIFGFIYHLRDIVVGHDGGIFVDRLEDLYQVIFSGKRYQKHTERFDIQYLLGQIPGLEIFTTKINQLPMCRLMGVISPETHEQFSHAVKMYFSSRKSVNQSQEIQTLLMKLTDDEFKNITQDDIGPLFEDFYRKPMKSISAERMLQTIEHMEFKREKPRDEMENSQLSSDIGSLPNSCGISNPEYDPYFRGEQDLYVVRHRRYNTTQENIDEYLKSR